MSLRNTRDSWGSIAKTFHWVIAVLVLFMIALGWTANLMPRSPLRIELFAFHKSTGLVILTLMSARLLWRLVNPVPILPPTLKGWEKAVATATHWLMYAVVFVMPISGYIITTAANVPFKFYKTFSVPMLVAPDRALAHQAADIHEWGFWVLATLLALHISAALRHHFILRDNTLVRMLPGSGRGRPGANGGAPT
jgi:cytochrome b561